MRCAANGGGGTGGYTRGGAGWVIPGTPSQTGYEVIPAHPDHPLQPGGLPGPAPLSGGSSQQRADSAVASFNSAVASFNSAVASSYSAVASSYSAVASDLLNLGPVLLNYGTQSTTSCTYTLGTRMCLVS